MAVSSTWRASEEHHDDGFLLDRDAAHGPYPVVSKDQVSPERLECALWV